MHLRDKMFLTSGVIVAGGGAILTLTWSVEAGVVALLVLGLIALMLVLLQRRQLARVQQRTLALLNSQQAADSILELMRSDSAKISRDLTASSKKVQQDLTVSTSKLIGLLQAQQVALELLEQEFRGAVDDELEGRPRA